MADNNDTSSIFWGGIVTAGILYFIIGSLALSVVVGVAIMFISWVVKGIGKQAQPIEEQAKDYAFDFDALSPTYKSQLLRQQFDYFFNYRTTGNGDLELYCAEDELEGYRFSFWVDYLVGNSYSQEIVKVKKGNPICVICISSNKGKLYGYEQFTIDAPTDGAVTGFLRGMLQKNVVLFRIKGEKAVEIVEKTPQKQEIPQVESTVFFEDVVKDLLTENQNIEIEKLDDVLKWEMPAIDDIEMPEEENSNVAYAASLAYRATITNLSDFDWVNFNAVCYSSKDDTQKEVKYIGNMKIGTKTLLSSHYDMFYLEGENVQGEQKRFRPFELEKDRDITVTTIFIERD